MEEELGHGRLVCALQAAVETIVGSLEGHLEECIGGEAHGGDKVLTEPFKVQHLKVVLVDQIGQVGFGESQGDAQLRGHVPLELPRRGAHIAKAARVSLGWVGAAGRPESWGLSVDCLGETEDGIGVDIAGKPQHRVAIHTGVFEVDPCAAVLAHNDLELVIPPVGASTHLHAPDHLAGSADHVCTELRCALGFDIVQAEDKKRRVDNVQALRIVGALVPGQDISHSRPHLTVLRAENSQCALRRILDGRLFSVLDDDLEVEGNVLLAHDQITVLVENIKPIDLSAAQNRKVLRTRILADNTTIFGWNTRSTEQSRVLVHAKRGAPDGVRWQLLPSDSTNERQGRDGQGCSSSDLVVPCGSWVIFQQEEWVEVQNNSYRNMSVYRVEMIWTVRSQLTVIKVQV